MRRDVCARVSPLVLLSKRRKSPYSLIQRETEIVTEVSGFSKPLHTSSLVIYTKTLGNRYYIDSDKNIEPR